MNLNGKTYYVLNKQTNKQIKLAFKTITAINRSKNETRTGTVHPNVARKQCYKC